MLVDNDSFARTILAAWLIVKDKSDVYE